MFDANQFKRSEELLQEILIEVRILGKAIENLPDRIREALNTPAAPKPEEPSKETFSDSDIDTFLKNNLKMEE